MAEGYRGGPSIGTKWGCGASALFSLPVFLFLLVFAAMGDCEGDRDCHPGILVEVVLPTAAVAAAILLVVRWAVNRLFGRDDR